MAPLLCSARCQCTKEEDTDLGTKKSRSKSRIYCGKFVTGPDRGNFSFSLSMFILIAVSFFIYTSVISLQFHSFTSTQKKTIKQVSIYHSTSSNHWINFNGNRYNNVIFLLPKFHVDCIWRSRNHSKTTKNSRRSFSTF
jgi:hypothetical protein